MLSSKITHYKNLNMETFAGSIKVLCVDLLKIDFTREVTPVICHKGTNSKYYHYFFALLLQLHNNSSFMQIFVVFFCKKKYQ